MESRSRSGVLIVVIQFATQKCTVCTEGEMGKSLEATASPEKREMLRRVLSKKNSKHAAVLVLSACCCYDADLRSTGGGYFDTWQQDTLSASSELFLPSPREDYYLSLCQNTTTLPRLALICESSSSEYVSQAPEYRSTHHRLIAERFIPLLACHGGFRK